MNLETLSQLLLQGRLQEAAESVSKVQEGGSAEDYFAAFSIGLLTGDFDGAARALELIESGEPDVASEVQICKGLLNSERRRQAWRARGEQRPSVVAEPPSYVPMQCKAWNEFVNGEKEKALKYLEGSVSLRPSVCGELRTHDDHRMAFDDIGDADTFNESTLEVLCPDNFFIVPFADILSLDMELPRHLFEAVLCPTRIRTSTGLDGTAWVPVLYAGSHLDEDADVKTGNVTKWNWVAEGVAVGTGQRVIRALSGDEKEEGAESGIPWKMLRAVRIEKVLY